jgi:RNA polymerase sigma factor (sigma-70 family)
MKTSLKGMEGQRVARALAGDPEALNDLCQGLWPWAVAWVQQHFPGLDGPEDVVGGFWLHLLESECAGLHQCRDSAHFSGWLERGLENWCRNEWGRQQQEERWQGDWPAEGSEEEGEEFPWEDLPESRYGRPERELLRGEFYRVVGEAIRQLSTRYPDRDRALLERRLIQGQTNAEVGAALGLPRAFVGQRCARLCQVLARQLSAAGYGRAALMGWAGELYDPGPPWATPVERLLKAQGVEA